ncbi:MAG: hypothetical protein ACRC10_09270 [Thermoguttaceae bacterium]
MLTPIQQVIFSFLAILGLVFGTCQIRFHLGRYRFLRVAVQQTDREGRFQERQARRRLQIGMLTILVSLCVLGGTYIPFKPYILLFSLSWLFVIFFLFWTILLAVIDMTSIRLHYGQMERKKAFENLRMQLEKRRHQQEGDSSDR